METSDRNKFGSFYENPTGPGFTTKPQAAPASAQRLAEQFCFGLWPQKTWFARRRML